MKILALSDIHGAYERLYMLERAIALTDLVLVAGDLTEFGDREDIAELARIVPASKLVAVTGNCDRPSVAAALEEWGCSAEERTMERAGVSISGTGGGLLKSGLTPDERTEEELGASLREALTGSRGENLIILTHTPPFGMDTDQRRGRHVGSHALREILDHYKPLLWISGHIHESRAVEVHGRTTLVNPGSLYEGCYALIDLVPASGGGYRVHAELK